MSQCQAFGSSSRHQPRTFFCFRNDSAAKAARPTGLRLGAEASA
jgi:hypothetical protein